VRQPDAQGGWEVVKFFVDAAASGKSLVGREALAAALVSIEAGDAEVLVVAKLDRLSRSLLDFAELMARARDNEWNLVALDLGIDLSTPAGEFLSSIMASAAQWERRIIGQRTREALAVKRASGVRLGRPPTLPQAVVERIRTAREGGMGLAAIAEALTTDAVPTAQGGRRWYASTVRGVLERTRGEHDERHRAW